MIRPSAIGKIKFSLFGKYHLFRIESFRVDFRCVHRLQLLKVCNQYVTCVGCDIVQADHAPEAGVAQGIFHGILVRHHGRNQEEVEEGLEEEVEGQEEEENTQEQVRMPMTMDGNEDTQTRLEPHVTV